jgi:hypothetical protein
MQTPFFPQLRARFAACRHRLHQARQTRLHQLEQLFGQYLPPGLLAQADEGANSRERVFSRRRTFWGFLYQVLHPGCPCRTVVRHTRAFFRLHHLGRVDKGTSAYCQARLRLPLDTLTRLRHAVAARVEQRLPHAQQDWLGLHPKVIDGTTVTAPDTAKNQRAYPQSRSQKPGCGFPLLKLVAVFSLASGVLLDYAKGNKHQHELALLHKLLDQFKPKDLALGDRGFCGYALIALLLGRQVQSLFRLHQSRDPDLRRGQRLGKHDRLFTWRKPPVKPRYLPNTLWKRVPEELSVRVLRFRVAVPGFRPEAITLVTTLTDARAYPASELARLYARRWRIELWFRDIKTTLGMETLHCQSPRMLHKELEMYFIAYNLIRAVMVEAAAVYDVPVERISFKGTVDSTVEYSQALVQARSQQAQHELVADLLAVIAEDVLPERPGRCEPRARKRRPKNYPLLNKPRHQFKEIPHRNRHRKNNPKN